MIVRALALGQITAANARMLFVKEIGVSVVNGLIWGGVVGLFAFLIYHSWQLGLVMMLAMVLNLLLAAMIGVAIPLAHGEARTRPGRGLQRHDHRHHRQRGVLHLPGAGDRIPCVTWE